MEERIAELQKKVAELEEKLEEKSARPATWIEIKLADQIDALQKFISNQEDGKTVAQLQDVLTQSIELYARLAGLL